MVDIHITVTGPVHIHETNPDSIVGPILAAIAGAKGEIMSQLDDQLAELKTAVDTNTAKLATLIADFEAAGSLTPAQQDALNALKAEVVGNSDAIDAADPNAVTP